MPILDRGSVFVAVIGSAVIGLGLGCGTADATSTYIVSFDDPGNANSAYYQAITTDLQAAGTEWSSVFGDYGIASIGLQVAFDPAIPTMDGTSTSAQFLTRDPNSGLAVYEQGAAAKLKGDVPNVPGIDGRIRIGEIYLTSDLWFDPSPAARTAVVPSSKVDAYSDFLHELGHVFAFNGFRDGRTGALSSGYESTFDRWVVPQDGNLFFEGPHAEAVYGGPVPLTYGDYGHVGNGAGRPGQDLIPDLMNGVYWLRGARYEISPLDQTIEADAGLPVADPATNVPEPPSLLAFAVSLMAVLLCRHAPRSAAVQVA